MKKRIYIQNGLIRYVRRIVERQRDRGCRSDSDRASPTTARTHHLLTFDYY